MPKTKMIRDLYSGNYRPATDEEEQYSINDYQRAQLHVHQDADPMYKRLVFEMTLYLIPPASGSCVYEEIEITDDIADVLLADKSITVRLANKHMKLDEVLAKGATIETLDGSCRDIPLSIAVKMANRIHLMTERAKEHIQQVQKTLETCEASKIPDILGSLSFGQLTRLGVLVKTDIELALRYTLDLEALANNETLQWAATGKQNFRRLAKILLEVDRAMRQYEEEAEELAEAWETAHNLNGKFPNRLTDKQKHDLMRDQRTTAKRGMTADH